ncbi:hypothetical protein NEOLEDRAFT_1178982 [Neolentinus lepideus HHB14362 ss-1]|uniref:BTB domain-containing protein n=1 Tax=Neolentinus lepideus HHB14362 ss-1 TaxID=1314782 RepID=A0A165SB59_9AGAM|nr:hypothetical protein NEOLEDRAFT_1178982 [Neolentinus lepideus HHB14362 ss-1]
MSASPTRHPTLYFEDGSMVLRAQHLSGELIFFKVHKTVLSMHSEIFRDMFILPSPSPRESYDGVSLLVLQDNAEELASFLACLYDPIHMTGKIDRAKPFWQGAMCLATKYFATPIRSAIIRGLEQQWPTTFREWEQLERRKLTLHDSEGDPE